ncbi:MAG TPA: GntR family transcriptional regulator [Terracidiphilus sp.]|jgi:DNA-binding GntR family transcriptional regulator|nr:GntR family transcriptional regulator [Terracidiphilus sp.]
MPRRSNTHHPGPNHSVRAKAYLLMQKKIASGELPAGSLVSELAISKELGCSRTPVREAVSQLLAEGLLEVSPGGGIVITRLTRQGILDLYELREALEVFAVGRATRTPMMAGDRKLLESLIAETPVLIKELEASGQEELNPEQMRRFSIADLGFHALLIRMAANVRILKVVNDTRLMIRVFGIQRSGHKRGELERIHKNHLEIFQAVIERDSERAQSLLASHIQTSARERLDEFDHREREVSLASIDWSNQLVF